MPCLSVTYDPRVGPVINVGFAKPNEASDQSSQKQLCPLLVDTGADITCVSPGIADGLGINPISKKKIQGATGISELNVYLIDLLLPFGDPLHSPSIPIQTLVMESIQIVEFQSSNSAYQGLLGRDILSRGLLSIEGWENRIVFCV